MALVELQQEVTLFAKVCGQMFAMTIASVVDAGEWQSASHCPVPLIPSLLCMEPLQCSTLDPLGYSQPLVLTAERNHAGVVPRN
jgi:hypothetical protein